MNEYRVSGVLWLLASVIGGAISLVFREDAVWRWVTLGGSVAGGILGILLIWRISEWVVRPSIVLGGCWVALYTILIAVQSSDVQAWTADGLIGVVGAAAAVKAFIARRTRFPARSQPRL